MALIDHIRSLVEYDRWANQHILDAAVNLSTDHLISPAPVSHENILGNLAHIVWADTTWLSRWMGEATPPGGPPDRMRDLTVLRDVFADVGEAFWHFVASLGDQDLDRVITYYDTRGRQWERHLATLVLQVLNHGTYHRGETAIALTQLGHSPGDLDYLYFTFERDGIQRD